MEPVLNKNNIELFLKFFEKKVDKKFDEATLSRWRSLDEDQLPKNVNRLLEYFGFTTDIQKTDVIKEFVLSEQTPKSEPTKPLKVVGEDDYEDYEPSAQPIAYQSEPRSSIVEPMDEDRRSRTSVGRIFFVILLIATIAAAAWLWAKYSEYNSRAQIYSLGDNIKVRKDLTSSDIWPTRLYMFGKYRDSDGQISKTSSSLPLVDDELYNNYFKVYMDTSFTQYLMGGEQAVGYVHSKYVTRSLKNYNRYLEVFTHFSDDYEEMEQLPFEVRRILVNTIYNYPELKGKKLSPPCFKEPKPIRDAPMSVGVVTLKIGKALQYYVIARIDGLYYTIHSNKEGTEIYLDKVKKVEGPTEVYLDKSGKFVHASGPASYPGLQWTSCDKETTLYSYYKPFNYFEASKYKSQGSSVETVAPTTTQEDFIDAVEFSD